jgi:ribonuclease HI
VQESKQQEHYITFAWVPSHTGIPGNEAADTAAKETLSQQLDQSYSSTAEDIRNHIKIKNGKVIGQKVD